MHLFQVVVFLSPAFSHIVHGGQSDITNGVVSRERKFIRRQDLIESSGEDIQNTPSMDVTIRVPLNTAVLYNDTLSKDIPIPYTSIVASSRSNGGGNGGTIGGGAFAGRKSGRGTRNEIYGTARYGSGYGTYDMAGGGRMDYTPDFTLNVSRRDFPHGFPPLTWGNYSGGTEYLDASLSDFPGVTPPSTSSGYQPLSSNQSTTISMVLIATRSNQTWFILGDGETLDLLNMVLQLPDVEGGCDAVPTTPLSVDYAAPIVAASGNKVNGDIYTGSYVANYLFPDNTPFHAIYPWNVLQFYRGSSIALGSFLYDNAYAHNGNSNTDYWSNSPLNTTGIDMDFLTCLNITIATAIPIVNPALMVVHQGTSPGEGMGPIEGAASGEGMSPRKIAGIVGGIIGVVVVIVALLWFYLRFRRRHRQSEVPGALLTTKVREKRGARARSGIGLGEAPSEDTILHPTQTPPPVDLTMQGVVVNVVGGR